MKVLRVYIYTKNPDHEETVDIAVADDIDEKTQKEIAEDEFLSRYNYNYRLLDEQEAAKRPIEFLDPDKIE